MIASQLSPAPERGQPATLAAMHDFAAKLLQPSLVGRLSPGTRPGSRAASPGRVER